MSSKHVGINHKEYAVTSTGVVTFVERTLKQLGINMRRDPFTVKFTGGPERRRRRQRDEHHARALPEDGDHADPRRHRRAGGPQGGRSPGAAEHRAEAGPRRLRPQGAARGRLHALPHRQAKGGAQGAVPQGDAHREGAAGRVVVGRRLLRAVRRRWCSRCPRTSSFPAAAGPRPSTRTTGSASCCADGTPSSKAIIEGANSFITPAARLELQKKGVIVMRDASANKCGVISSSYEIIAEPAARARRSSSRTRSAT